MFRLFGLLLVGLVLAGCQRHNAPITTSFGYGNTARQNFPDTLLPYELNFSDSRMCGAATLNGKWETRKSHSKYVQEAKRRGLSCGVGEASSAAQLKSLTNEGVCRAATYGSDNTKSWSSDLPNIKYLIEAKIRNISCGVNTRTTSFRLSWPSNDIICKVGTNKTDADNLAWSLGVWQDFAAEAKRRGLSCGVGEVADTQIASSSSTTQTNTATSAELTASQKEAKRLRQELAAIKAQQEQQQQTISNDTKLPTITIASATTTGAQGVIRGRVNDNTGIAELRIDGQKIAVDSNGNFSATTYVPEGGTSVSIEAIDLAGLSSTMSVRVDRAAAQTASISFDRLNPLKRKALPNKDAVALIIGIGTYENIIDAAYADKDALVFRDYATEKLGIPDNQIKTLINKEADIGEVLLGIRKWIRRSTKPDKTDVYVFYAGHGIATATGEAYILPYDGRPEVDLLDRTALLQKELFAEIDKANPRNVTIFLDACYTGKARTGEVLMADANYRPIVIRPIDDGMPDNFTLITASSGDEFSGPLEEAKHGLFSYFLMKGMEGDADSNQDNQITSGELHEYVKENVLRQSADKQTPELQGDADRVLVRFQ